MVAVPPRTRERGVTGGVIRTLTLLGVATAIAWSGPADAQQLQGGVWQEDPGICALLDSALRRSALDTSVAAGRVGATLVDLGDSTRAPAGCSRGGSRTMYGASITKTLALSAAYQARRDGREGLRPPGALFAGRGENLQFTEAAAALLRRMIRNSSNAAATEVIRALGLPYIDSVAVRQGLYDVASGGGLWLARPYGAGGYYRPDPVARVSHAASADALVRYFILLDQSLLIDSASSGEMLDILGTSAINNRFFRALRTAKPTTQMYRKTGTYSSKGRFWAHEAALVRRGPVRYAVAVMCEGAGCASRLASFIVPLDDAMESRR